MIRTREDSFKTKDKGEKLQLKVRDLLRSYVSEPSLIQSQKMSAHGEDIIIDPKLRPYMPYSFECMYASRPITSTDLLNKMVQSKTQKTNLASTINITAAVIWQVEGFEPQVLIPLRDYCEDRFGKIIPEKKEHDNEVH
jgi:hypothetical protein|tara:strand:- start:489 stop:905 length:417 start_codon:yes stop_codon:yes gene_type:complete